MFQIIGRNKDKNTRAAIRWVKERRIEFQFINLDERSLAPKEWTSIFQSLDDKEDIIDKNSNYYKKNGYSWRDYDPLEEVKEHVELMVIPVLRNGMKAHVGWSESWVEENK